MWEPREPLLPLYELHRPGELDDVAVKSPRATRGGSYPQRTARRFIEPNHATFRSPKLMTKRLRRRLQGKGHQ